MTIEVINTRPEDAQAASQIVCAAYDVPVNECNDADQVLQPEHVLHAVKIFPEGQFIALADGQPAGMASTMRVKKSPDEPKASWHDSIGGLYLDKFDPNGEWLYGVEVAVKPQFRRRGIGTALYEARFALVRKLGLKGWYAGGMLMGYHRYQDEMTPLEYGNKVIAGDLTDPTVTMQMNRGFRAVKVIENYLVEEPAGDAAVLLIYDNPDLADE